MCLNKSFRYEILVLYSALPSLSYLLATKTHATLLLWTFLRSKLDKKINSPLHQVENPQENANVVHAKSAEVPFKSLHLNSYPLGFTELHRLENNV